jgi:SpoVK/Ycf46/Vps4 family AAA+-type ATPase
VEYVVHKTSLLSYFIYLLRLITVNLQVSLIEEVKWHTESFQSLVIDPDTKELIIALITNKIEADRGTDLIAGKGNGLVILLHGGPGTGKTLTAERYVKSLYMFTKC